MILEVAILNVKYESHCQEIVRLTSPLL